MSFKYDHLEISRIIGEPRDPRRPYPLLVDAVCEVDSADPDEYAYYYDVVQDTDKIYVITSAGSVTTENVTPDTPALLSWVDIASPEYYVKIIDLAKAKERVLGRKKATINRALNAEENRVVVQLLDAAAIGEGNLNDLRSGEVSFNYEHLIDMIDQIIDYSENYVLVAGTQIDKDLKLWNWRDSLESPVSVMAHEQFGYIGETPERDNTEATCESRESVETKRRTPVFIQDEDIVRSAWQHVESNRNVCSLFSKN